MTGIWSEEDGWHCRPKHEIEVRVPAVSEFEPLRRDLAPAAFTGAHEADRAIVFTVAEAKLAGEEPDWSRAHDVIAARLSRSVASTALGGVRSSEVDTDEFAAPLRLGDYAVAGHLDPSLEDAAADLARRHGLPGYRFGDESWWTEDFLSAKEDRESGREWMEEISAAESWPWFVLIVAAPVSGAASEAAAIATAEAVLGALILLDHAPGAGWVGAVPWIAGGLGPAGEPRWPGDDSYDWVLPIAPQHVDAMVRHLDNAENVIGDAPARAIDVAVHAQGPAGDLLVSVINSSLGREGAGENLAKGCRLAWLAAATETASTRWALARCACAELICAAANHPPDLLTLATAGGSWRRERDSAWPSCNPFGPDGDLGAWERGLASSAETTKLSPPSWAEQAAMEAQTALDLAQACFFGLAMN